MNKEKIIEEAKEYVNNDLTVEETATSLGISKRTFQIHLKQLGVIDPFLHGLVLAKKESNMKAGRIKGGEIGRSHPSYTAEEAIKIANTIIINEYTYEEASEKFGIPRSTIYEMVHSSYIPMDMKISLDRVAVANKKGVLAADLSRGNYK